MSAVPSSLGTVASRNGCALPFPATHDERRRAEHQQLSWQRQQYEQAGRQHWRRQQWQQRGPAAALTIAGVEQVLSDRGEEQEICVNLQQARGSGGGLVRSALAAQEAQQARHHQHQQRQRRWRRHHFAVAVEAAAALWRALLDVCEACLVAWRGQGKQCRKKGSSMGEDSMTALGGLRIGSSLSRAPPRHPRQRTQRPLVADGAEGDGVGAAVLRQALLHVHVACSTGGGTAAVLKSSQAAAGARLDRPAQRGMQGGHANGRQRPDRESREGPPRWLPPTGDPS